MEAVGGRPAGSVGLVRGLSLYLYACEIRSVARYVSRATGTPDGVNTPTRALTLAARWRLPPILRGSGRTTSNAVFCGEVVCDIDADLQAHLTVSRRLLRAGKVFLAGGRGSAAAVFPGFLSRGNAQGCWSLLS